MLKFEFLQNATLNYVVHDYNVNYLYYIKNFKAKKKKKLITSVYVNVKLNYLKK